MTTRKFHMAHCPSCEFYIVVHESLYDESPMTRSINGCQEGGHAIYLKDSTAIKCKYYQQNEENKDAIITNAQ